MAEGTDGETPRGLVLSLGTEDPSSCSERIVSAVCFRSISTLLPRVTPPPPPCLVRSQYGSRAQKLAPLVFSGRLRHRNTAAARHHEARHASNTRPHEEDDEGGASLRYQPAQPRDNSAPRLTVACPAAATQDWRWRAGSSVFFALLVSLGAALLREEVNKRHTTPLLLLLPCSALLHGSPGIICSAHSSHAPTHPHQHLLASCTPITPSRSPFPSHLPSTPLA